MGLGPSANARLTRPYASAVRFGGYLWPGRLNLSPAPSVSAPKPAFFFLLPFLPQMFRLLPATAAVVLALLAASPAARAQSSRSQERARAEKMRTLDTEIEKRRTEAPIPDEGTTDMNGVDLHKKRQLEIIEARLNGGNTYEAKANKKDNQYESSNNSGFTVHKWRPRKGGHQDERGYARPAGGIDPAGEPLVKNQRKFFLNPSRK